MSRRVAAKVCSGIGNEQLIACNQLIEWASFRSARKCLHVVYMSPVLSDILYWSFSSFRHSEAAVPPSCRCCTGPVLVPFLFHFIITLRTGAETITTVWVTFGSYVLPSGCVRPTLRFTELCELALILTCSVEQVNTRTFYLIRGKGNFAINAFMSV